MSRGLIVGRFLPPHRGHALLMETAAALCDRLTVLLCWDDDDPIPGETRAGWLREMVPTARIVTARGAAAGADERARLAGWSESVRAHHSEPVDFLFAGDTRCAPLADDLGARFVLLDPAHGAVPASSAAIRADPFAHWRDIPAPVRPYYARTICLHGPESTGKSTLAPLLAAHFDTLCLPEYGRTYCENFGLSLTMDDLVEIARTQEAMTRAALRQCNRRLILDTDPLMTAAWARMLFDRAPPELEAFDRTADLYLLLDIDMPWVDDGTRFFGDEGRRRRFLELSRDELERRDLPYAMISGRPGERFDRALEAIAAAGLG